MLHEDVCENKSIVQIGKNSYYWNYVVVFETLHKTFTTNNEIEGEYMSSTYMDNTLKSPQSVTVKYKHTLETFGKYVFHVAVEFHTIKCETVSFCTIKD